MKNQTKLFSRLAKHMCQTTGSSWAFMLACLVILAWAISGPIFHFSDTWQLVINTGTTIVTFLMVFLIQNSQNRDTAALQIKLDELIRSHRGAHNALLNLEELEQEDLELLRKHYERLAHSSKLELQQRLRHRSSHPNHQGRAKPEKKTVEH